MATKKTRTTDTTVQKATELLIVTGNEMGVLARITAPLAKNKINIVCFSGYEWSGQAAFRLVTNNNRKAIKLMTENGFAVQENPVTLWNTTNKPGRLNAATVALAKSGINTYCTYQTSQGNSNKTIIAFGTADPARTPDVLKRLK